MTDQIATAPQPANTPPDPRAEQFAEAKAALIAALRANNISHVEVEYDGEGDEGQIQSIAAFDANNQDIPTDTITITMPGDDNPEPLREAIDAFAWDVLDAYHCGFENNDGGCGTITISATDNSVTLDHGSRYVDIHYSSEEF